MSSPEQVTNVAELVEFVNQGGYKTLMVLSHDTKFAIARGGKLIHRDKADFMWFRKITDNRACIVGSKTYPEVCELPGRVWVRLGKSHYKGAYCSDNMSCAVAFAKTIASSKNMDSTIIIAGGAVVYDYAIREGRPDVILATIWASNLQGDQHVIDYTTGGRYKLLVSVPLDVVGDVPASVCMYVRAD